LRRETPGMIGSIGINLTGFGSTGSMGLDFRSFGILASKHFWNVVKWPGHPNFSQ
jgi:hypothetical protein